jgi:hypothetical protein
LSFFLVNRQYFFEGIEWQKNGGSMLIRGHHIFDGQFTQVPNTWLRDKRISLAAKGLIAQLLSHRPGWSITLQTLAIHNACGRDKIRTLIRELEAAGYLHRSENQRHNEQGHLAGFDYTTADPPLWDLPTKAKPTKVEPTKENPTLKNTIEKNTISKNTIEKELAQLQIELLKFQNYKLYLKIF